MNLQRVSLPVLISVLQFMAACGPSGEDETAKSYLQVETQTAVVSVPTPISSPRAVPARTWSPELIDILESRAPDKPALVREEATEALLSMDPAPVEELVAMLGPENDELLRLGAAEAFKILGSKAKSAVPQLAKIFRQSDGLIAVTIAEALGAMGPDAADAVPVLVGALQRRHGKVDYGVIRGLAGIGPAARDATPLLIEWLCLGESSEKINAARALGAIFADAPQNDPSIEKVVAALTRVLKDQKTEAGQYAATALCSIGPAAESAVPMLMDCMRTRFESISRSGQYTPFVGSLYEGVSDIASIPTIVRIGPKGIDALVETLGSDQYCVLQEAERLLYSVYPQMEKEKAAALSKNESALMRIADMLQSEAELRKQDQVTSQMLRPILECAMDETFFVRGAAASSLGRIESASPQVFPVLQSMMQDENRYVRFKALETTQWTIKDHPEAAPVLLSLLHDESLLVRVYAAGVLRFFEHDDNARPVLIEALKSEQAYLCRFAADMFFSPFFFSLPGNR